ncbi:MAG: hypothetical protein ACRCTQ_06865 [Brevinemataceae bacterium]
MNGSRTKFYLYCITLLLIVSCRETKKKIVDGNVLFFIDKSIKPVSGKRIEFWKSIDQFQMANNSLTITEFFQIRKSDEILKYSVLRIGKNTAGYDFVIQKIYYSLQGTHLNIFIDNNTKVSNFSDAGYPIFLINNEIKYINILDKNKTILTTNISL